MSRVLEDFHYWYTSLYFLVNKHLKIFFSNESIDLLFFYRFSISYFRSFIISLHCRSVPFSPLSLVLLAISGSFTIYFKIFYSSPLVPRSAMIIDLRLLSLQAPAFTTIITFCVFSQPYHLKLP